MTVASQLFFAEVATIILSVILLIGFIMQTFFRFSKRDWIMIISSIVVGIVLPILKNAVFW